MRIILQKILDAKCNEAPINNELNSTNEMIKTKCFTFNFIMQK